MRHTAAHLHHRGELLVLVSVGHLAEVSAGRHLVPGVQVVQHAGVDAGSRLDALTAGQAPGYMTILYIAAMVMIQLGGQFIAQYLLSCTKI